MTKEWFGNIAKRYRRAYYECHYHFVDYYPESWKEKMKDVDYMIDFFRAQGISIGIESGSAEIRYGGFVRFSITGKYHHMTSPFEFHRTVDAQWAALEFAFMVWDYALLQAEKEKDFTTRFVSVEERKKELQSRQKRWRKDET